MGRTAGGGCCRRTCSDGGPGDGQLDGQTCRLGWAGRLRRCSRGHPRWRPCGGVRGRCPRRVGALPGVVGGRRRVHPLFGQRCLEALPSRPPVLPPARGRVARAVGPAGRANHRRAPNPAALAEVAVRWWGRGGGDGGRGGCPYSHRGAAPASATGNGGGGETPGRRRGGEGAVAAVVVDPRGKGRAANRSGGGSRHHGVHSIIPLGRPVSRAVQRHNKQGEGGSSRLNKEQGGRPRGEGLPHSWFLSSHTP